MEDFREAVRRHDAAAVRSLLAANPELRREIDRPIFETAPAIVHARHDRAVVDVLLEFGADINARSQFWGRAVGVLDDNTPEMREYLIERGALPALGDFADAVNAHDAPKVRQLLSSTPALRHYIDRPLFPFGAQAIVVAKDDRAMVDVLLEYGADINVRSDWGPGGFGVLDNTEPAQASWLIERGAIVDIHAAAALGMIETVREWLAKDPTLVHAPGGDGQRPLHFASTTAIVDLLLDFGAHIDARDVDHHATAAQYKVRDVEVCRHLIARGAAIDIFMAAALGDRALVDRAIDEDPGCLAARIGQPGYPPVQPGHIYQWKLGGPSVLMVAGEHGGPGIYEYVLNRSGAIERFLEACRRGDTTAARALLAQHPNLIAELPADRKSQIVEAAFSHNLPALETMLDIGFDIDTRGAEGFTPVSHAALRGDVEIVRFLIRRGADVHVKSDYGGGALESCQWGSLNFRDPRGDYAACAQALIDGGATIHYPNWGSEAVRQVLQRS
jgi:ankyrin repeat protein